MGANEHSSIGTYARLGHTVIKQKDKLSTSYDDCKQYEKEGSYWQVEWLDLNVFIMVSSQL